jgi:hypothetical protein
VENVFGAKAHNEIIDRINKLTPETKANWGEMCVDQMLAHCNVTYEMAYENKHPKPSGIKKFLVKTFVKNAVVGLTPYQ